MTPKGKDKIVLNADNHEHRRQFEHCVTQGKRVLNPIIDWPDADVWEFLRFYGCRSNPLYECGYKRVGCIGCPMTRPQHRITEFVKYPKYKAAYIRAFDRMIVWAIETGKPGKAWKTGQEVFDWWIADPVKSKEVDEMQMNLLDFWEGDND